MSKLLPEVCSNSCPLGRRCHLTISSSAASLSLCLQCFPVPESFPVSQLFALGGQNIGASASVTRTVKKKKKKFTDTWDDDLYFVLVPDHDA